MKPSFAILAKGYPRREQYMREALYDDLGWSDLKAHPSFQNTCAIRISVALNSAGVPLTGWLKVKTGPLTGKSIEPSHAKLSQWLKQRWGEPELFKGEDAAQRGIGNKSGVVSFWGIDGTQQGHIDLVKPDEQGFHACAMSCYFKSREIWFWHVL